MELAVTVEQRFERTPDGTVWTQGQFAHSFWERYLEVFDRILILARCQTATRPQDDWQRVSSDHVELADLPYYVGPWQYLRKSTQIKRAIRGAVNDEQAVILRVSSQIANCLFPNLTRRGKPFAVEAVANAWDLFAPGVVQHPLRPLLRRILTNKMRQQCRQASAVAYVTDSQMQQRYPPHPAAFTTHYSSVELPRATMVDKPRIYTSPARRLVSVGSMAQLYKGFDVLIDALHQLRQKTPLQLTIVGDGVYRSQLESQATALGCRDMIRFTGALPAGRAVQAELDQADLFVLPSRSEGLPRAMIEAMARGLPCLSTAVGGIPELLPSECLVEPNNAPALAARLHEVTNNTTKLTKMSASNLDRATDYTDQVLRHRRLEYYRAVKDTTSDWLHEKGGCT